MAERIPGPLARLTPWVRPHARWLVASLLLRTLNLSLGVALLGLSGAWIARFVLLGDAPSTDALVGLAALGVGKAVARYAEQVAGHAAAFRILESLRNAIFAGFARGGVDDDDRSGDLVTRVMGDVELVEVYFAHTLAPVGAAVLFVLGASAVVVATAGPLAGVAVFALLVTAGGVLPVAFQRMGEGLGAVTRQRSGALGAEVAEGLAGLQDLLVSGAEARWDARIADAGAAQSRATVQLGLQSALKDVWVDLCLVASLLAVVGAAAVSELDPAGRATLWGVACGLAGGFGAVLSVSRAVDDLPRSAAAARRVLEILDRRPSEGPGREALSATRTPELRLDALTVRHRSGRGIVDVDLTVAPGEHVFVTGRSGSGKSTLAAAVLGLLRPTSGTVTLDGVPVSAVRDDDLRACLSAAGQSLRLVPGSVADNVALGARGDGEVPPAAYALAELDELYAALGDGALTRATGADERLSGGQQRRIALARLVAREPRIAILDEAFAGLDGPLRARLRGRVLAWARAGSRTVIEISHEIEEASAADRVVVLDEGRVVESGSFDRLRQARGALASLADGGVSPAERAARPDG